MEHPIGNMSPGLVKQYLEVMKEYGVQNLQVEDAGYKLIISGRYDNIQPITDDEELSREEAIDKLR